MDKCSTTPSMHPVQFGSSRGKSFADKARETFSNSNKYKFTFNQQLDGSETQWLSSITRSRSGRSNATRQSSSAAFSSILPSRPSQHYLMSEARKQEKDFTPEVDTLLPEAKSLAEVSSLRLSANKDVSAYYWEHTVKQVTRGCRQTLAP